MPSSGDIHSIDLPEECFRSVGERSSTRSKAILAATRLEVRTGFTEPPNSAIPTRATGEHRAIYRISIDPAFEITRVPRHLSDSSAINHACVVYVCMGAR
jgi:hypothetical protein